MDRTVTKILSIVALETLEKMAFIFGTSREENASSAVGQTAVAAEVGFCGVFSGILRLRISVDILPELAANMLGVDASGPVGIDHQHDALREVANVICGSLMPILGGKEAEFSIEQPILLEADAAATAWVPGEPIAIVCLELEEGGCDLALSLAGDMPVALPPEAIELAEQAMDWTTL